MPVISWEWLGMCISSHLFHSSSAEQPKPIFPRGVNRYFYCNYKSLWRLFLVMTTKFIIVRSGWESCLDPKPALPGLEEDKTNKMPACSALPAPSPRMKKKIIQYAFWEMCIFRNRLLVCGLVAIPTPAHIICLQHPPSKCGTEFCVLQSQKVWGLNEHSEIFEMANPLRLSF